MPTATEPLPGVSNEGAMSRQLKYQRVEAAIRLLAKMQPIGSKLPAERELAVTHRCNFLTVRRALKGLVDDGTIVRRVGSGTFVASPREAEVQGAGRRIGILSFTRSDAYAHRTGQAINWAGADQQVRLVSAEIASFDEEADERAAFLKSQGCVALVLPWFPAQKAEEVREFVGRCALPASLPTVVPGLEKNCFEDPAIFGATTEMEDLCRYFTAQGHERIAFLGPDSEGTLVQEKVNAFVHFTSRENLWNPCSLLPAGAGAMDHLAERWKTHRGKLAVISYDDEHALRFMTAMHKLGLTAPADYCIIGFNDTEASRYSDPPLTTIRQNYRYIAHWLIKNALALAEGKVCQSSKTPRHRLLVRGSCGGRGKVDDAFRAQVPNLDLILDEDAVVLNHEVRAL